MAAATLAFAPEDLLARSHVAGQRRVEGSAAETANVRGHFPDIVVRKLAAERRHLRGGDAALDRVENLRVGGLRVTPGGFTKRRSHFPGRSVWTVAHGARLVVDISSLVYRLAVSLKRIRRSCRSAAAGAAALRKDGNSRQQNDHQRDKRRRTSHGHISVGPAQVGHYVPGNTHP